MKAKLILILILFAVSSTLFSQVQFSHTNISNAQLQASSSDLPYFVYIYGDWCLPCQIMEETTFKNLDLQKVINEKYTAYKVDFHSETGAEWVAEHEVCCLPTFMFFDSDGNKIQQIQSPLTANSFMRILDNPQLYSEQDEAFTNANSAEKLKNQISSQAEMREGEESIVMTAVDNMFSQSINDSTPKVKKLSEFNNASNSSATTEPDNQSTYLSNPNTIITTGIADKTDFLNDLRTHISSLEAVYAKYELEEDTDEENPYRTNTLAQMEGFGSNDETKSDCECENITNNAKELAETIKELKAWENQLNALVVSNTQTSTPTKKIISATNENKDVTATPAFISNTIEERPYYSVQMGMFKTESYARRMVNDLAKSYTYSIEMKTVERSGNTLHRVLLGPFMEESEAKEVYSKMRADGRKAVVGLF